MKPTQIAFVGDSISVGYHAVPIGVRGYPGGGLGDNTLEGYVYRSLLAAGKTTVCWNVGVAGLTCAQAFFSGEASIEGAVCGFTTGMARKNMIVAELCTNDIGNRVGNDYTANPTGGNAVWGVGAAVTALGYYAYGLGLYASLTNALIFPCTLLPRNSAASTSADLQVAWVREATVFNNAVAKLWRKGATIPAYAPGVTHQLGDPIVSGGTVYLCSGPGTTAGAGPSGTSVNTNYTDGGGVCLWTTGAAGYPPASLSGTDLIDLNAAAGMDPTNALIYYEAPYGIHPYDDGATHIGYRTLATSVTSVLARWV